MSKSIFILLGIIFSCQTKSEVNFDWLMGNWVRTNEQPDRATFENWEKINDSTFSGESYTIKDNDTIWKETVKLSKVNNDWYFAVKGIGDTVSVDFKLISITDSSFVCENKVNEFPNIIRYEKAGEKFKAEVEGGDMKIDFEFKRVDR